MVSYIFEKVMYFKIQTHFKIQTFEAPRFEIHVQNNHFFIVEKTTSNAIGVLFFTEFR